MKSLTNILTDAHLALRTAQAQGDTWRTALEICQSLGAQGFNVADFSKGEFLPNWWRSSLTSLDAYEEYITNGYLAVDPILNARIGGRIGAGLVLSTRPLPVIPGHEEKMRAAEDLFRVYDADSFFAFSGQGGIAGTERVVSFNTSAAQENELFEIGTAGLSMVGNILAEHVSPPVPGDDAGHVGMLYEFLTEREHDALCFLASGLSNDRIAHAMGIAEVTVRHHVRSARIKMGARTREQAIAKAILRGQLRL